MNGLSLGLLISGAFAALVTFGALHSAVEASRGRVWEMALWVGATFIVLAVAAWCVTWTLVGDKPDDVYVWAATVGPALLTLALIARSWAARRSDNAAKADGAAAE